MNEVRDKVELPMKVLDKDGDSVMIYYQFHDSASWNMVPWKVNQNVHVIPFSIFAGFSSGGDHSMQIYGWDGLDSSEPVTLDFI
jgi:hypothetical protein